MFVYPTNTGSDIGLERLSYQSKIISINIRISLLLSRGKVKHVRFLKSPQSFFLQCFLVHFKLAAAFSFTNLFFPSSRFRLLSSVRSLCCLPHFAPTALRKKNEQRKKFSPLWAQCETPRVEEANGSKLSKCWLAQLPELNWCCVALGITLWRKVF